MSETLRDLVVSLSLQSDNFIRNIKSVNKQIQEAESYFKLASAGVAGFEGTTEGLSAELSMLERRLKLQKDAMNQYQQAMTVANAKLQECFTREGDYANRLDAARVKQSQLKEEVNRAAAKHREYADTLGESDSATIAAKANLDALEDEYKQASDEVKKLSGQHDALKKSTQNAADAVSTAQTKYNGAQAAIKQTAAEIERCRQRLALSQTEWDTAGKKIAKSEVALRTLGKELQLAQSRFRLAAAGIKDFDKSAAGLTAKLTLLNDKLALQKKEVTEYENKLKAAKEQLKAAQDTTVSDQLAADIATLDAMDSEIERLLKKKQSKLLSEKDKIRLQELIDAREAIEIKYHLSAADPDSFETIGKKVAAEVARAQARGQDDASVTVYENAMVAAAEGMAAVNSQLDAQYDKEYAVIQLIEDSTERQAAMDDLNKRYKADRLAAAREYAATMAGVIMPVWNEADIQKAGADIDTLTQKLAQYSAASESEKPALLQELNELTAGMDESSVTEYIALLTQVQSLLDSGMSEAEVQAMFPEIDFSTQLEQIAAIQTFLSGRETLLPGLASMFSEAIPDEMLKITTDLDMTGAQARWDEFAANPGAITTAAIISGYAEAEGVTKPEIAVAAFVSSYTEVAEGASTASLTPTGILAYVTKYAEVTTGVDVSGYTELATGTDVSLLTPDEITAYVSKYLNGTTVDQTGLTPAAITATVMAYQEVTGGALTTALTPTDIAAIVTQYLLSANVDMSNITDAQVDAMVTAYAEATGCDKSALKAEVVAQITAYEEAENVTKPTFVTTLVSITGYDLTAYRQFVKNNPIEVAGIVRLGSTYENPTDALVDPNASFWQNGMEIPAEMVPQEQLTADKVAVLADDGTLHILLTPELTGSEKAITALRQEVAETDALGVTELGKAAGIVPTTVMDMVQSAVGRLKSYEKTKDYGLAQKFWATLCGESTDKGTLDTSMQLDFSPDKLASLTTYVQEMVTAIQNGEKLSEEDLTNLKLLVEFLDALELAGVGENVTAGIGEAMVAAGWDTDAESVAQNMENALNTALDINSPSKRMYPIGENTAAGVGAGFDDYDPSADANTLAGRLETTLSGAIDLRSAGTNAMKGLQNGIIAGRSGVISAMRSAARAAVTAAKNELQIHSPSAVFRDEVVRMTMKGFGEGVLMESKAQAKAIQNASRFLTGEAKESAIAYSTSDNRKTYNQQSSVSLTGNTFYVRDDKDVYALATEIAALTKRQQRGKGLRMA